jgi:hypothetical protein
MRELFCILFIFIAAHAFSKEESDTTKSPIKLSGVISLNSNGIAPIPAFSLGQPALIAGFSMKKKRFSYDPQLSYTLNFKPWIIDNWLHYRLIDKPRFVLRTGVDASMFFSEYKTPDVVWRGQRYGTLELMGLYKISQEFSLALMYWYDRGLDKGTIRGHFFNMVIDRPDIGIGKKVLVSVNLQVFYINYTGKNDGLFLSPKLSSSVRNVPISVFFQAIQAVTSNINPFPGFRWNAGLAWPF